MWGSGSELLANARLIAAAPDLYAVCKAAAAQFRFYEEQHKAKGTQDGRDKAAVNAAFAEHMEAALARAAAEAR